MFKTMIATVALASIAQTQVGNIFCTSYPNNTGQVAHMSFCDVQLTCMNLTNATPNGYTQLIYGSTAFNSPFGNGHLCVNPLGGLYRVGSPVPVSALGTASVSLPQEIFATGAVTHFQWMYRDIQNTGYTFNTSNALRWPL